MCCTFSLLPATRFCSAMKPLFFCLSFLLFASPLFAQTNFSIDIGTPYAYDNYDVQGFSREAIGLGVGFPVHRYGEVRATARYSVFYSDGGRFGYSVTSIPDGEQINQQWVVSPSVQRIGNLLVSYAHQTKEDMNGVAAYAFGGTGLSFHTVTANEWRDPNNPNNIRLDKPANVLLPGLHVGAGASLNKRPRWIYFFQAQFGKYYATKGEVLYSDWYNAVGYWNIAFGLRFKRSK